MKYITEQEIMEKMKYSNMNSFKNSKTNYKLLLELADYIESKVIRDYEIKIKALKLSITNYINNI